MCQYGADVWLVFLNYQFKLNQLVYAIAHCIQDCLCHFVTLHDHLVHYIRQIGNFFECDLCEDLIFKCVGDAVHGHFLTLKRAANFGLVEEHIDEQVKDG